MTTSLSVTSSTAADAAGAVAQVVASLPVSLRHADGPGDLVAVAGGPGWPQEAEEALGAGARGIMVIDPVAADVAALRERARAQGAPVGVDATWTYTPAVRAGADAFARLDGPDSLVEARVDVPVGSDLERVLLAQLALVRAAVGPVADLAFARRDAHGYDALADLASGARGSLTAVLSGALPSAATVRVVRPRSAAALRVPAPLAATPGAVVVSGEEGATLLPTQWETAHRAAWRRLHHLVETGGMSDDLDGFAEDVALVRGAQ